MGYCFVTLDTVDKESMMVETKVQRLYGRIVDRLQEVSTGCQDGDIHKDVCKKTPRCY